MQVVHVKSCPSLGFVPSLINVPQLKHLAQAILISIISLDFRKSDIAISAGGTSCYELAYFGIPNIIITIAKNQINSSKELNNKNISIYLGSKKDMYKYDLINKINELIENYPLRVKMSNNGKKLVDGNGKKRIVDFMESIN